MERIDAIYLTKRVMNFIEEVKVQRRKLNFIWMDSVMRALSKTRTSVENACQKQEQLETN